MNVRLKRRKRCFCGWRDEACSKKALKQSEKVVSNVQGCGSLHLSLIISIGIFTLTHL